MVKELLEKMPPVTFGGDMVEYVYEQEATFDALPYKFKLEHKMLKVQ